MRTSRNARRKSPGLGLLIKQQGLAMVQTAAAHASPTALPLWHWQALGSLADEVMPDGSWPDPKWVRQVRQRSGFQAQLLAMAIPREHLFSMQLPMHSGIPPRQLRAALSERLQDSLPWPLVECLWDFQTVEAAQTRSAAPLDSGRPAWLNQAMQDQPVQHIEVLAMPRDWATQCEQWCSQAGLQLVRLEPPWQASLRWQTYAQNHSVGLLQENPAIYESGLSEDEQAVVGGLALGVVSP
jgi:hypothetical protein